MPNVITAVGLDTSRGIVATAVEEAVPGLGTAEEATLDPIHLGIAVGTTAMIVVDRQTDVGEVRAGHVVRATTDEVRIGVIVVTIATRGVMSGATADVVRSALNAPTRLLARQSLDVGAQPLLKTTTTMLKGDAPAHVIPVSPHIIIIDVMQQIANQFVHTIFLRGLHLT